MFITCPKCSVRYKIPSEIKLVAGKKMQCSACQHIFEFQPEIEKKPQAEASSLVVPEDAVLSVTAKQRSITIRTTEESPKDIQNDSTALPEVFRPVRTKPVSSNKSSYVGVVLCGFILILLAFLGWMHRDLLRDNVLSPGYFQGTKEKRTLPEFSSKTREEPIVSFGPDIPLDLEETDLSLQKNPEIQQESLEQIHPEVSPFSVQSVHFRSTSKGENPSVLIEGILKNNSTNMVALPEKVYALGYGKDGTVLFEKEIYLPAGSLAPESEQAFFGTYAPAKEGIQWIEVVLEK